MRCSYLCRTFQAKGSDRYCNSDRSLRNCFGGVNTGLFSADDQLAAALTEAGKRSLDPAWRLPLEEEYQELINSPFADVANVGGREAGSVTAACFCGDLQKLSMGTLRYCWNCLVEW